MVRWERTVRIKPGKFKEALGWAKEVASYVDTKFPEQNDILVFMQNFGEVGTIQWAVDADDAATLGQNLGQLMGDDDYWAVVNKGADFVVEASGQDKLWHAI